jgi:hypothetical protein
MRTSSPTACLRSDGPMTPTRRSRRTRPRARSCARPAWGTPRPPWGCAPRTSSPRSSPPCACGVVRSGGELAVIASDAEVPFHFLAAEATDRFVDFSDVGHQTAAALKAGFCSLILGENDAHHQAAAIDARALAQERPVILAVPGAPPRSSSSGPSAAPGRPTSRRSSRSTPGRLSAPSRWPCSPAPPCSYRAARNGTGTRTS